MRTVTATEFQRKFGEFWEVSAKTPVFITKHDRPARVMLDEEEYRRLKDLDDRQALYVEELTKDERAMLRRAKMARRHDPLDELMD
jgi:prevent-host-death family protein